MVAYRIKNFIDTFTALIIIIFIMTILFASNTIHADASIVSTDFIYNGRLGTLAVVGEEYHQ